MSSGQKKAATEGGSSTFHARSSTAGSTMNRSYSDSGDDSRGVFDKKDNDDSNQMQVDSDPDGTSSIGLRSALGIARGGNVNVTVNYYVSRRALA